MPKPSFFTLNSIISSLFFVGFFTMGNTETGYTQSFQMMNPLGITPSLSGNYGELRPNHFHAGLDLKTAGTEGLEVMAVAEGFISRIKISPYGYGKAVYVEHPDGFTTVYGHLSLLNDSISRYVKRIQYEQESFEIEIFPGKADLPVKQGEVIAYSGNTGGSGGPHLHFEVRETQSEVPRNPLVFGFPLSDHQSPVLQSIAITPLEPGSKINGSESTQRFRVSGGSSKTINTTGPAQITGAFGIQVQGYDQQDGANNQNGIFSIVGKIDGKEFTRFTADSIPFDQSRCLNALIDYEYYYQNNSRFMRLYRLPGNTLPNLKCAERGVLKPTLGKHNIVLVARDYSGNSSSVSFDFYFSEVQNVNVSKEEFLPWNTNYFYESENVKIQVQSGSIYQNEILKLKEILTENGVTVEFMRPQIPLQLPFLISLKSESISPHQLIAEVSSSGKPTRALSTQKNEQWLSAESKSFGRFAVVSDSERPKIVPVTFHEGIRLSAGKVRFEISDNFSGIESFRVEVDGKWILAEYEPKQKLLFFDISEIQSSIEKQHLLIKVTDGVGNVATFEAGFYKQ